MVEDIVLFTGGFDPIHSGHIEAIKQAKQFGRLVIGLNSDEWLSRKKGKPFMPFEERKAVLDQFKDVLQVIDFNDSDNTAIDAINKVKDMFPNNKIIFVNGGDRTKENIPEQQHFIEDTSVQFVFSVGGNEKKNSSSWILSDWKHPTEDRNWGKFMLYYEAPESKVKRLIIEPGKSISMQYHNKRKEFWFVEQGIGKLLTMQDDKEVTRYLLRKHDSYHVEIGEWHRLENIGEHDLCVIEIQYGELCDEQDIIRK